MPATTSPGPAAGPRGPGSWRACRAVRGDLDLLLPYDEVVAALGLREIVRLGLQSVDLDSIVGSTDRIGRVRPALSAHQSGLPRERFERLAAAARRGESFPPVDLYRVGALHFVRDGHHRVAVARALDWKVIPAYVTEVRTACPHRRI